MLDDSVKIELQITQHVLKEDVQRDVEKIIVDIRQYHVLYLQIKKIIWIQIKIL